MKILLSTCLILVVLLPPVASLTCQFCAIKGRQCKTTTTMKCEPHEQACLSAISKGHFFGFSMTFTGKSCIAPEYCIPGHYSFTLNENLYGESNIFCCKTDNCNQGSLELPAPKNRIPNGMQCPSCYSLDSDHCKNQEVAKCTEQEDHCFYYAGFAHLGNITMKTGVKGCATANVCALKMGSLDVAHHLVKGNVTHGECYPAKKDRSSEL